jgi:hypothetical protein
MKFTQQRSLITSLFFCLILFPAHAFSAIAGHVILTKGSVTAISDTGESRELKRRSKIMSGDIIKTGLVSSIQIRFVDKALMTIKANSEMNIAEYQLANPTENIKEKALMKLVKGGFRTISGQIGKGDKSAYRVDTPAASIGIRGTNYEVHQEASGDFVMAVYSGGISVENAAGSIQLGMNGDYNFTRVSKNKSPKGLLLAPETLTENSATDEVQPEEDQSEENDEQESSETESKETENKDKSAPPKKNLTGKKPKTDIAQDDNSENNVTGVNTPSDISPNVDQETSNALDQKLNAAIDDSKKKLEEALVESGFLTGNETLADLDEADIAALENIKTLGDIAQVTNSPFPTSYTDPSTGINYDLINQSEYNQVASGKLGVMVMPMDYNQDAAGDITFNFSEANLTSPGLVVTDGANNYIGGGLPIGTAEININYEVLDTTTNITTEFNITIPIDQAIVDQNSLLVHIQGYLPADITATLNIIDSTTSTFSFNPATDENNFMTRLELNFSGSDASILETMLGGDPTNYDDDDWYNEADLETFIESGAWELSADGKGNPILVMTDTTEIDGTELIRNEIAKPTSDIQLENNIDDFLLCGNAGNSCGIQVNKNADKIRWGAWLTEPGKGIIIYEQIKNADGSTHSEKIREENQILAFWLAAERADINTLSGSANFSSSSLDCLDFSQCIGIADDGLVQSLTGSFDVNFNSGAITNGNLNIEVLANADLANSTAQGSPTSIWNVNFAGQMAPNQPEFITNNITSGSVTGTTISTSIIGNVGGIFVDPGNIFAGGYNLGTADGTNKKVSGVFTLDKQP